MIGKNVKAVATGAFNSCTAKNIKFAAKKVKFGTKVFTKAKINGFTFAGTKKQKKAMAKAVVKAGAKKTDALKKLMK